MGNIVNFPDLDNASIKIERTEAFKQAADKLSDFIKSLPLNHEENDRLVALMVQNVREAEKGAFLQGFSMGYEFGEYQGNEGDL